MEARNCAPISVIGVRFMDQIQSLSYVKNRATMESHRAPIVRTVWPDFVINEKSCSDFGPSDYDCGNPELFL